MIRTVHNWNDLFVGRAYTTLEVDERFGSFSRMKMFGVYHKAFDQNPRSFLALHSATLKIVVIRIVCFIFKRICDIF